MINFNDNGTLGDVRETISRDGIVREMEVDTIMSLDMAKNLRDWLTTNIEALENATTRGDA